MTTTQTDMESSAWESPKLLGMLEAAYQKEHLDREWPTEKAAVQSALKSIGRFLRLPRYSPKDVLGVGGSGIVLRLTDSLFPTVDNALKFPRPIEGKADLVAEMLTKELKFLADLGYLCPTPKNVK